MEKQGCGLCVLVFMHLMYFCLQEYCQSRSIIFGIARTQHPFVY